MENHFKKRVESGRRVLEMVQKMYKDENKPELNVHGKVLGKGNLDRH